MRQIFERLGANVLFESDKNFGHMLPADIGRYSNPHIYENLPNSGFDSESNQWNQDGDLDWVKTGYSGKFDQSIYTDGS